MTTSNEATSDYGTLADENTIRFERDLPGPIERVWAYLVEKDLRAKWISSMAMPTNPGDEWNIRFGDKPEDGGLHGHLLAFDPPHVLEYVMIEMTTPAGPIRDSIVRFELTARGERVHLVLTQSALPARAYESVGGGWHALLDVLRDLIDGCEPDDCEALFDNVKAYYAALGSD